MVAPMNPLPPRASAYISRVPPSPLRVGVGLGSVDLERKRGGGFHLKLSMGWRPTPPLPVHSPLRS
eukprot:12704238-Prorocentrum_lima.AAC.1